MPLTSKQWHVESKEFPIILDSQSKEVFRLPFTEQGRRDARFIVELAESNADLLKVVRVAREHLCELADAWRRGILSEHDGRGGERSNRNVEIIRQLETAIAKAEESNL